MNQQTKISVGHSSVYLADAIEFLDSIPDNSVSLVVTSPPYNIGKEYERDRRRSLAEYAEFTGEIISRVVKKVAPGGSICWQSGNYVKNSSILPLDYVAYPYFELAGVHLRNRIIWRFNFGLNSSNRFSGRYETLLWYTKGKEYTFNLDPVRIPQIYPGKRHASSKLGRAGLPSGNPLGKNPSDFWEFDPSKSFLEEPVWEIPNVKANHPEKTAHPCQFPVELAERCVLALTSENGVVLDPFAGVGSTILAAEKHGRIGIGCDKDEAYVSVANQRLSQLRSGTLRLRPLGRPVTKPNPKSKVASVPSEWASGKVED